MEKVSIHDLKLDEHNANTGTERGQLATNNSLRESGAGRSVVLAEDGTIIGGNKATKAAIAAGIEEVIIVRTTGKQLVAVLREDIKAGSKEAKLLAVADNRTAELGLEWNPDELSNIIDDGIDLSGLWLFEPFELEDLGVVFEEFQPVDQSEQPSLDKLSPVICPHCGKDIRDV